MLWDKVVQCQDPVSQGSLFKVKVRWCFSFSLHIGTFLLPFCIALDIFSWWHRYILNVQPCRKPPPILNQLQVENFPQLLLSSLRVLARSLHSWLSRIPAPVGSQEVVEHTHKLAHLIDRCLSQCISGPTCTTICYPTCTYLLPEVWKPLKIASLPATQRVQEILITQVD